MIRLHWAVAAALLALAGSAQALERCDQYVAAQQEAGEATAQLQQYETSLARADAQFTLGNYEAVIDTLHPVLREICSPLAGESAWQLVGAYLAERRAEDAERVLAPLLQRAEAEGVETARAYALDWRVQCGIGRLRPCVTAFMRTASRQELTVEQARWFNFLLPNIVKYRDASDLLRQAKARGWIDWRDRVVASRPRAESLRAGRIANPGGLP